jgi:hypothetical protein
MTPEQLEKVQMHARILAIETLLASLFSLAANIAPNARQALLQKLDAFAAGTEQLRLQGVSAEYSDMIAAEAHEAFVSLAAFIKSNIDK